MRNVINIIYYASRYIDPRRARDHIMTFIKNGEQKASKTVAIAVAIFRNPMHALYFIKRESLF